MRPRIARVHVDAIGAAIDLRGAELHQLDQALLEPASLHRPLEIHHRLHQLWRGVEMVETRFHGEAPSGQRRHISASLIPVCEAGNKPRQSASPSTARVTCRPEKPATTSEDRSRRLSAAKAVRAFTPALRAMAEGRGTERERHALSPPTRTGSP